MPDSYGTVEQVENRIGDLVTSRSFTASTTPTEATVSEILDSVANEINATLAGEGFVQPIDGSDYPAVYGWAARANAAGAAAIILNTFHGAPLNPDDDSSLANRRSGLWAEFNRFIKAIQDRRIVLERVSGTFGRVKVGSAQDSSGNTKLPVFKRDMFDYPGSVTRTSS